VTTVIKVPPSLDEHTFEQVLEQVAGIPEDAKMLLDARHTKWASPYGLTALLTLGQVRRTRATLAAPDADDTLSYWSRANFFYYANDLFDLQGVVPKRSPAAESQVLLPITPVSGSEDVHQVVGHIQQKAQQIIATEPKAHAILPDPANRYVFVPCLGGDVVLQFRFDAATGEAYLATFHPGQSVESVRAQTGWELRVAPDVAETPTPTASELAIVRDCDPQGFWTR